MAELRGKRERAMAIFRARRGQHPPHIIDASEACGGGDSVDRLERIEQRMALKDAEIRLVVEQHASNVTAFISWNAKHFAGKLPVPALTPREWLKQASAPRRE